MNTIYGISYKPGDRFFAKFKKFRTSEKAHEWLETEEYDFRERVLLNENELSDYEHLNTLDDGSTILDCFPDEYEEDIAEDEEDW